MNVENHWEEALINRDHVSTYFLDITFLIFSWKEFYIHSVYRIISRMQRATESHELNSGLCRKI